MHKENNERQQRFPFLALAFAGFLTGCATTNGGNGNNDPAEPGNRIVYDINENLDKYFIKPVAEKYVEYTPKFMRTGITNFYDNLTYPNVMLNSFLQGKIRQGFVDLGRLTINTVCGVGGFFDLATKWGVPRHYEDFGQTLGVWGMGEVVYLVLPLKGPNSVRDAPDLATSTLINPFFYIVSPITIPVGILGALNERAKHLETTRLRDEAALDPYTFTREAYRQKRTNDIYDGNPPGQGLDEFIEGEEENGVLIVE
jgi:phospholipid-binding lipoprotein MlaA